ncbi:MAG TPA: VTT domain-containing protein [Candidatus Thermoplasmatota archaeon]|nr:VTT domain-containing protein [Candidatus Thermoplasmatota archaeon]
MVQAPAPVRTVVLRDYFGPSGRRLVPLVEWQGDPESGRGMAYRVGNRIIRANNAIFAALTGLPGQFRDNWLLMRDPLQRRLLARSLVDDALLTNRRRKALFSMLFWGALIVWSVVGFILLLVNRSALVTYQSGYSLFLYSLATSIFLPTPFEILLSNAVNDLGVAATIAIAAVAKTAGSWIVLLMGDKANAGMSSLLERHATLARMFKALERFAQKYGYFAIFILFAIPFMTDTAPLFILAVLRMKKLPFLAVTFAAIVVRSLLYIYAWDLITG